MEPLDKKNPVILNIGCGFTKMKPPVVNVDKYPICAPDVLCDMDVFPYPWEDFSVDHIFAFHIMEHLDDWWRSFIELSRILKLGGFMEMRVPDESSSSSGTYRDHKSIITLYSFCGVQNAIGRHNTNAWAAGIEDTVPMRLISLMKVPHPEYNWICKWFPRTFKFFSVHLRNFIWEQRFVFRKIVLDQNAADKRRIYNIETPVVGGGA